MDCRTALAGMARATQSVDSQAHSAFDRTLTRITARMPVLLPVHQLSSFLQLSAIGVRTGRVAKIFGPHLERIHIDLRGQIVKGSRSDEACLRMIGSSPRASAA